MHIKRMTGRASTVGAASLTGVIALASMAIAATTLDSGDVAIVGGAATSPGGSVSLVRGGSTSFEADVTANNGNIPDNGSYPASGTVTLSPVYTASSTGLSGSGTDVAQTFNAAQTFGGTNGTPQTLSFTGETLTAGATAPLGYSSYDLTFGSASTNVLLGSQVQLGDTFTAPTLYLTVNPRPASNLQLTVNGGTEIDLAWTASPDAGDITDYVIERGGSDLATHPAASATTASDTGLTPGTTYCYRIRARYNDGTNDFFSSYAPSTATCVTTASVGYTSSGFLKPVDTTNTSKAGQTIPLKWVLTQGGTVVSDTTMSTTAYVLTSSQFACTLLGTNDDPPVAGDAGSSGLRFDPTAGQSIFNWQTNKSWANTCRRFTVTYDGSPVASAQFQFTR